MIALNAHFDGKVLVPDEQRALRANQKVRIQLETIALHDGARADFWQAPTIEELALSQDVRAVAVVRAMFGTWPDEENDGFEAAIDELRHPTC